MGMFCPKCTDIACAECVAKIKAEPIVLSNTFMTASPSQWSISSAPDPRIAEITALKAENEKIRESARLNAEGWGKALQWRKGHEGHLAAAEREQRSIADFWKHSDEKLRALLEKAFEIITNTAKHCDWKEWHETAAKFREAYRRDVCRGFKAGPSPLADLPKIMANHEAMVNAVCQQFALSAEVCGEGAEEKLNFIRPNRPLDPSEVPWGKSTPIVASATPLVGVPNEWRDGDGPIKPINELSYAPNAMYAAAKAQAKDVFFKTYKFTLSEAVIEDAVKAIEETAEPESEHDEMMRFMGKTASEWKGK